MPHAPIDFHASRTADPWLRRTGDRQDRRRSRPLRSILGDLLRGAASGLLATAPMSAAMLLARRQLPATEQYPLPPFQITRQLLKKVGIDREFSASEKTALTVAAHFSYGAAMGAIYNALGNRCGCTGPASGTLFGMAVWGGSYLGMLPAMGLLSSATDHPARRNALMIGAHLVWGCVLGSVAQAINPRRS